MQTGEVSTANTVASAMKRDKKPKGVTCSVPHCRKNNRNYPGLRLAKFPSDEARCREWVRVVGDPDLVHVPIEKLSTLRTVCSFHFKKEDFLGRRLCKTAIPTIFPPAVKTLSDIQMDDFVGYARPRPKSLCLPKLISAPPDHISYTVQPIQAVPKLKPAKPREELTIEILDCESSDDEMAAIDDEPQSKIETMEAHAVVSQNSSQQQEYVIIKRSDSNNGSSLMKTPAMVDRSVMAKISPMVTERSSVKKTSNALAHSFVSELTVTEIPNLVPATARPATNSLSEEDDEIKPVEPTPMQVYPMRLKPGSEITSYLQKFVTVNSLKAAFIVTCVGSITGVNLRFATNHRRQHVVAEIKENLEICSLVGTVSVNGLHLHGTFGRTDGTTVSGHVMGNMTVQTTAEIVLGEATGAIFHRAYDSTTGFKELVVTNAK